MGFTAQSLKDVKLQNLADTDDINNLKQIGFFLLKYQKYRDVYEEVKSFAVDSRYNLEPLTIQGRYFYLFFVTQILFENTFSLYKC